VNETERVKGIYEELSDRYDRLIGLPEKLLFKGGREWVCSQARGEILEIAPGTCCQRRNFEPNNAVKLSHSSLFSNG
jgi:hypothetical protein